MLVFSYVLVWVVSNTLSGTHTRTVAAASMRIDVLDTTGYSPRQNRKDTPPDFLGGLGGFPIPQSKGLWCRSRPRPTLGRSFKDARKV
eukprot:2741504-Amphidinium_carterae.1